MPPLPDRSPADLAPARPLAGVRVVDLGQYIAAPGVALALAELGADVVKIEPPGGDQARGIGPYGTAMVRAYNRGKRSIAVDLKSEGGREIAWRLLERADVVVQNLRPGAVESLGFDPAAVRGRFPRIVYLSIAGFPSRGPSRDRPGYDIAAQAESGLMSVTGEPDGLPQKVGVPVVDAAAAHVGAEAVLAALFARERSGVGATIETSLLEVALHLQATTWADYLGGAREPERVGNGQPHVAPAAEVVATRDGHIVLSAYADAHWTRLCRVLGRDDWIADPRFADNASRVANRDALRAGLREGLAGSSSREAVARLHDQRIVAAEVRRYGQVLGSEDVARSGLVVEATGADGTAYRAIGMPVRFGAAPQPPLAAAPDVGADTCAVLAEVGYGADAIAALRASGAVAG